MCAMMSYGLDADGNWEWPFDAPEPEPTCPECGSETERYGAACPECERAMDGNFQTGESDD